MDKRRSRPEFATETEQPRKSNQPLDNLTLDCLAAQALGYGCRYGDYKADHPYTKAERETSGVFDEPQKHRKGYERICAQCGEYFLARVRECKYCSDTCKGKANTARYRAKQRAKKEEKGNG